MPRVLLCLALAAAVACTAPPALAASSSQDRPSLHPGQPALLEGSLLLAGARRLRQQEGQAPPMGAAQGGSSSGGGSLIGTQQGGQGGGSTQQGGGGSSRGPAMPLSQWASETLAHDGWLVMAFVVAWAAAPGVALLVWAFVFDGAMSLSSLLKSPGVTARLARMQSFSSFK